LITNGIKRKGKRKKSTKLKNQRPPRKKPRTTYRTHEDRKKNRIEEEKPEQIGALAKGVGQKGFTITRSVLGHPVNSQGVGGGASIRMTKRAKTMQGRNEMRCENPMKIIQEKKSKNKTEQRNPLKTYVKRAKAAIDQHGIDEVTHLVAVAHYEKKPS